MSPERKAALPAMSKSEEAPLSGARSLQLASLPEVHRSVAVPRHAHPLRTFLAFLGPGYLIAVGYMDPGNWATNVAGGSAYGYQLLSVILLANIMAMLLQALCVRLGVATGRDLAQHCAESVPRPVAWLLWLLAETAICATDLAELIGTAIALKLLFGIPLMLGLCLTAADALLILYLQRKRFRYLEALIIGLIVLILICFVIELVLAPPDWAGVAAGYLPSTALLTDSAQLYLAIGILGATVMPHNLYLHSSIVQTRRFELDQIGRREAIWYGTADSTLALLLALLVNSAMLILAASAFHATGRTEVASIEDAYQLLAPLLGVPAAATLFGVALLAAGQNATITGTLAGQVVMEGFLRWRLPPWLRRLVTRLVAIIPAIIVTWFYGERGTTELLILSQVILSMQLPFAVVPLLLFTSSRRRMGPFVNPLWLTLVTWVIAGVIIAMNVKLLSDFLLPS